MILHRYEVHDTSRTVKIVPFGDLQIGEQGFQKEMWQEFKHKHFGDKNCYFIGMGDYCLPLDSKILTRDGFKKYSEVVEGQDVLAYDQSADTCRWTPLLAINVFPLKKIIRLKSKSFDIKCTPDHRWFGNKGQGKYLKQSIEKAIDLPTSFRIQIAAKAESGDLKISDDECAIIGWIVTDGHIKYSKKGKIYNVNISQKKEPQLSALRILLKNYVTKEYRHKSECITFNLEIKKIRALLNRVGIHKKEDLPSFVCKLPESGRAAMLKAFFDAEGTGNRFAQKPGGVLEAFKILCTLQGERLGIVKARSWGVYCNRILKRKYADAFNLSITEEPPETVWCPTTKYGSWVTQQGEQITITGNSDTFRTTINKSLQKVFVEDTSAGGQFEDMMLAEMQRFAQELKPIKNRIIGLHEGHHFYTTKSGTTTEYLCQLLRVKYLDFFAATQFVMHRSVSSKTGKSSDSTAVDIVSTHGCGGASHIHADLANLERKIMPFWDADIFLRGHSTKIYCVEGHPLTKLTHGRMGGSPLRLVRKSRWLVNTGGFMEGYSENMPSNYVEQRNMPRCALGWAVIELHKPAHEPGIQIRAYKGN